MSSLTASLKIRMQRQMPMWLDWGRRTYNSSRVRTVFWTLAAVCFVGGLFTAFWAIDLTDLELRLWPIAILAFVAIPIMLTLNALETECVARLFHRSFGFWKALQVTVLGSAANMLPLPGAAAVRVLSLKTLNVPAHHGTMATLGVAFIWLGLSLFLAGAYLWASAPIEGALACLAAIAVFPTGVGLLSHFGENRAAIISIVCVKATLTLLAVARMMLCFYALGVPIGFDTAAVFAVAPVLGSAASIVPAGLGVRELISAALAPLVGVSAALAFIATALDRLIALIALIALSTFFGASSLNSASEYRS